MLKLTCGLGYVLEKQSCGTRWYFTDQRVRCDATGETASMDKLEAWDASKADDPAYMMNMAKKYVILDTLVANSGKCTYAKLFEKSEEARKRCALAHSGITYQRLTHRTLCMCGSAAAVAL